MATYILKRKYFGIGAAAGKTLNLFGGGDAKNISTMNKVMGGMAIGGISSGFSAIAGSKPKKLPGRTK